MMAYFSQAQLDLEVAIESERILTVLDTMLKHMELAMRLPILLKDDLKVLRPLLGNEELEVVANCVKVHHTVTEVNELGEIFRVRHSSENKKISRVTMASGDSFNNLGSKKERQDPNMCRAIHLLCSKPKCLKKIFRQVELGEQASTFLTLLRRLRDYVELRLRVSPAMERMRDNELHEAWRRNKDAKTQIAVLKDKLLAGKKDADTQLLAKNHIIDKHKSNIAKLIIQCKQDCKKIISNSERSMVTDCKNSEFRRDILSQDVKSTTTKLGALLNEHLRNEKDLRAKRFKVEAQLVSWLEKYDLDIGEKQSEWEEVEEGFNKEKEEMAVLQSEFDIQEEEYNVLMAEKEEEYQFELETKMYAFLHNRSARRIQRYWRAYIERKLARKKARRSRRAKSAKAGANPKGGGAKKK